MAVDSDAAGASGAAGCSGSSGKSEVGWWWLSCAMLRLLVIAFGAAKLLFQDYWQRDGPTWPGKNKYRKCMKVSCMSVLTPWASGVGLWRWGRCILFFGWISCWIHGSQLFQDDQSDVNYWAMLKYIPSTALAIWNLQHFSKSVRENWSPEKWYGTGHLSPGRAVFAHFWGNSPSGKCNKGGTMVELSWLS